MANFGQKERNYFPTEQRQTTNINSDTPKTKEPGSYGNHLTSHSPKLRLNDYYMFFSMVNDFAGKKSPQDMLVKIECPSLLPIGMSVAESDEYLT